MNILGSSFLFVVLILAGTHVHAQNKQQEVPKSSEAPALPENFTAEESPEATPSGGRDLGILQGIIEDYDYRGVDKRDPFAIYPGLKKTKPGVKLGPVTQLERFDLEQLQLVAIMWNVNKPKALIVDPEKNNYIVYKKTRVGRRSGYVAEIREGEMIIMETVERDGQVTFQPRVIRLQRE